jgi:hypothetical protein
MDKVSYRGAPAGKTRFLGILDTVAAVGMVANGLNPHSADTGNVDIRLRPGVAEKVFHITAQHECRYNFALNSVALTGRSWHFPACIPISAVVICRSFAKIFFSPARWWKPSRRTSPGHSHLFTGRR